MLLPGYSDTAVETFSDDVISLPNDLVTPLSGGQPNIMTLAASNIVRFVCCNDLLQNNISFMIDSNQNSGHF